MLPQAGAFMLSALSAESIKAAPLCVLCASSVAGGEKKFSAADGKRKINRRDAKITEEDIKY
jgi:hypothetical protein